MFQGNKANKTDPEGPNGGAEGLHRCSRRSYKKNARRAAIFLVILKDQVYTILRSSC